MIKRAMRSGVPVYLDSGANTQMLETLPRNDPGTEMTASGHDWHIAETVDQMAAMLA